eukprot:m.365673 g.365673  ORF g.365673 m.365673 type:complete len:65 (+) comp32518_c0_seq1:77-271(+)
MSLFLTLWLPLAHRSFVGSTDIWVSIPTSLPLFSFWPSFSFFFSSPTTVLLYDVLLNNADPKFV